MELTPGDWLQYGPLGLVILAVIMGWLVPGKTHDRTASRADRLEAENTRLREHNEERVIPLLGRALEVLERSQALDRRGGSGARSDTS